jgi:dTDP-4-amino-4,6-dideoxygalactose transaminase
MGEKLAIDGGRPVRKNFLPFYRHSIGEEEIKEVVDTLKTDWISTGPKVVKFEEEFAHYIGCKHAIAVNSCTAALHLSLVAMEIKEDNEVITSPITFPATANVIIHERAKPVFVDIDSETLNIDPNQIEVAVTNRTKAIIPVHFAGHPVELDEIFEIAKKYNLRVIEDAAHAVEAKYKGKKIGTLSDTTCFSFYATKNLTTAEGGMVTTNKDTLAEKIKILRLHGLSKHAWMRYSKEGSAFYEAIYPGYKYNMTDIQAAIGIHQLKKLPLFLKRREKIWNLYQEGLKDIPEIVLPKERNNILHSRHIFPILVKVEMLKIDKEGFIKALKAENIGASFHFLAVHLHPYYRKTFGFKEGDFPNAEYVSARSITLPLYPKLTDKDVEDVIYAVKKIVRLKRK